MGLTVRAERDCWMYHSSNSSLEQSRSSRGSSNRQRSRNQWSFALSAKEAGNTSRTEAPAQERKLGPEGVPRICSCLNCSKDGGECQVRVPLRNRSPSARGYTRPQGDAGHQTSKRAPCPGSLATSMRPPWSLTMWSTTAKPNPVPRSFVEKKGSNKCALTASDIPVP